ncbi:hypothetical protein [Salinicoccus roseus]|nr:hypothetical protein [Salinicoccus roseus]
MEQHQEPNKDLIIRSLQQQMAQQSMMIAERDAIITELYNELDSKKEEPE